MQQISFTPHGGALEVNAFYASQQFLLKGYGNYLGLLRLGTFMADQMGLTFSAANVLVGIAQMAPHRRDHQFQKLVQAAESVLETVLETSVASP